MLASSPVDEWWSDGHDDMRDSRAAWINEQMERMSTTFQTSESLLVHCATMNCAAREVPSSASSSSSSASLSSFRNWLTPSAGAADLVVIGLQEAVSLDNPWNTVVSPELSSSMQAQKWADFLTAALNHNQKGEELVYVLEHQSSLVGLCLLVFAHATTVHPFITDVRSKAVGTGLWGAGNKGGLTVSLCIHDTSLCFSNVHLAAGRGNTDRRNADYKAILTHTLLPPAPSTSQTNPILWAFSSLLLPGSPATPAVSSTPTTGPWHARTLWAQGGPKSIHEHEVSVVMGDLNYHVEEAQQQEALILASLALESCPASTLQALLTGDQLRNEMQQGRVLEGFSEAQIHFSPTYRFRPSRSPETTVTEDEQQAQQQFVHDELRFPAWTDRIVYRCIDGVGITPTLRPVAYSSTQQPLNNSDHAAVSLSLFATVRRVDAALEAQCLDEVLAQLQIFEARMRPSLDIDPNVQVGELHRKRKKTAFVRMRNTRSAVPAQWRLLEVGRTKVTLCTAERGAEQEAEIDTTWLTFSSQSGVVAGRGSMSSIDGAPPPEASESEALLVLGRLDGKTARALRALALPSRAQVVLTCVCVLQVKGGSDHYLTVSAASRVEKNCASPRGTLGGYLPSSDEDEDEDDAGTVRRRRSRSPDRGPFVSNPSSLVSITSDGTTSGISTGSSQTPWSQQPMPTPTETPQKSKEWTCYSPTSWW